MLLVITLLVISTQVIARGTSSLIGGVIGGGVGAVVGSAIGGNGNNHTQSQTILAEDGDVIYCSPAIGDHTKCHWSGNTVSIMKFIEISGYSKLIRRGIFVNERQYILLVVK